MSMLEVSTLEKIRYGYKPKLPGCFAGEITDFSINLGAATEPAVDQEDLKGIFKHTYGKPHVQFTKGKNDKTARQLAVGVILSGGQAAGGHNVVSGLFDALKKGNANSKLFGFLGGPGGLIDCKYIEITAPLVDRYRNTGGFDIIGSGRTKIEKPEQFAASLESAKKLALNAIVIIGGDDSNTTAALLAEYFVEHGSDIQVIGCPKTIDGDLKNEYIETSFGFDTAVKTYSEVIGNICRDSNSAKKYWHFIKLMGRAGSHITLECALQTHPNVCLISEEVEEKKKSVQEIVEEVCDSVVKRAEKKENFGVVLIPEGLIEFIPEMKILIQEINDIMAHHAEEFAKQEQGVKGQRMWMESKLSPPNSKLLSSLPKEIAYQLLLDRDPHGNVVVSQIDTEKLIMIMVADRLAQLKKEGKYTGTFASQPHFFGYEGRSAYPSNFDADYCYSLGFSAFALIAGGFTGYLASVKNLTAPAAEWEAGGLPLVMMMNMEQRHGKKKAVIKKALVDLKGGPYQFFLSHRAQWALSTSFLVPGAIQYFGPPELCDAPTITLLLEQEERLKKKK